MARQPRFEYPGAVYHVMARGDGGKQIFIGREDHESCLYWLQRGCASHGWRVHAWVLMGNHFHLPLDTPEPNLVSGMRLLLGTFGKAWNCHEAERIVFILSKELGLPESREELISLRKNDPRKALCAAMIKNRTAVPNKWIAELLAMGHSASMSQLAHRLRKDSYAAKQLKKHEIILKTKD